MSRRRACEGKKIGAGAAADQTCFSGLLRTPRMSLSESSAVLARSSASASSSSSDIPPGWSRQRPPVSAVGGAKPEETKIFSLKEKPLVTIVDKTTHDYRRGQDGGAIGRG